MMKSRGISTYPELLAGWAETAAEGEEGSSRGGRQAARGSARASRIGFSRFYGQKVVDGARALAARLKGKKAVEAAALFLAGAAVVIGFAYGWNSRSAPPAARDERGTLPQEQLQERFFDAAVPWDPGTGLSPPGVESDWAGLPASLAPGAATAAREEAREGAPLPAPGEAGEAPATPGEAGGQPPAAGAPGSPARMDPSLPAVSVTSMVWPVSGGQLVRPYGWYRHPVFGDWRYASSVVIEPAEDGRVQAALAGRVRDVVYEGGLWRVTIDHAGGWRTEYEGLAEVDVASYQLVETGQRIGRAAPGGGWGIGFAVRQGDVPVDPVSLIGGGSVPVTAP